jgi:hypothetical protein
MTWPCDGRQTHVSGVVSLRWLQRYGSHNFWDWFIVVSFAFHSYYDDSDIILHTCLFQFWSIHLFLTMSHPAPCADSARPPGMLTCHVDQLCLMKKDGAVFGTVLPRSDPLTLALLRRQVFDAIKIATSLVVCFLRRHAQQEWWQHHGAMPKIIETESPRNPAGVLSQYIATVPYQVEAIITDKCSSRSLLSTVQHGHRNGWPTTTGKSVQQPTNHNLHMLMTILSESPCNACLQACSPLKLSLCHQNSVYDTYDTMSFLQQPSLHDISILISLPCAMTITIPEPALQAWFKPPSLCSLSHGKEKNTYKSMEIQKGLHVISVLTTLCLFMTQPLSSILKMIDLSDQTHDFTSLSLSGVSTKQFATQRLYWYGGQYILGVNLRKHYTVWAHECDRSQFPYQYRTLCSFLSKSLSTVGQGNWMQPERLS